MSVLHATSLGINSTTNGVEVDTFAAGSGGAATINTTGGRSGQGALKILNPATGNQCGFNIRFSNACPGDEYVCFYLKVATRPNVRTTIFTFHNSTSMTSDTDRNGAIELDTDGTLVLLYRDAANARQVIGSPSGALTNGTRYRIEIRQESASGNNRIIGRVDGTDFADSGATLALVNNEVCVRLGANIEAETCTTGEWEISDLVVHSTAGTTQNSWPGDGALYYLFPNAAGDFAEGAVGGSSPAATGWESVDDNPPDDGVTQWNLQTDSSATSGDPDRLDVNVTTFGTTPSSVEWVSVGARVKPFSNASMSYVPRVKSQASGTVAEGTTAAVTGTAWVTHDDTAGTKQPKIFRTTDPQTSAAWGTDLSGLQIGVRAPDGNPNCMVTSLYAIVRHVPGAGGGDILMPQISF